MYIQQRIRLPFFINLGMRFMRRPQSWAHQIISHAMPAYRIISHAMPAYHIISHARAYVSSVSGLLLGHATLSLPNCPFPSSLTWLSLTFPLFSLIQMVPQPICYNCKFLGWKASSLAGCWAGKHLLILIFMAALALASHLGCYLVYYLYLWFVLWALFMGSESLSLLFPWLSPLSFFSSPSFFLGPETDGGYILFSSNARSPT